MPIHKMQLEDGVFVAKVVGYFDNIDGRMWANALTNHAKNDLCSITAMINMVDVNRVCPTVIKTLAETSRISNLNAIALIVDTSMASQNARVFERLADMPNVRVFFSQEEAFRFAKSRLQTSIGGNVYASTFSNVAQVAY